MSAGDPPEVDLASRFAGISVASDAFDVQRARAEARRRLFGETGRTVRIGRFEVLRRLGSGAMGYVVLARDPRLDRLVALKLLHGAGTRTSAPRLARARLLREARALARIAHRNVVTVLDIGTEAGLLYVAMEFVEGERLTEWLARGRSWREIVDMFEQAGRGLAAAHAAGVIHRDFKPDNVLVEHGHGAVARVVDFGLATAVAGVEDRGEELTRPGVALGTPAFMAPEQQAGRAGPFSDQFAFCVALFEALYGVLPFRGSTPDALREAIVGGRIDRRAWSRRVPPPVREVVLRGLAADPAARWPSMLDLVEALRSASQVRARLRTIAIGGTLLAGVAIIAVAHPTSTCADASELWSSRARQRVRAALRPEASSSASEAWTRVDRSLEHHARTWRDAFAEACASPPDRVADLRRACLLRRRAEIEALIEALAEPEPAVVERAAVAVAAATPIDTCRTPNEADEPEDHHLAHRVARVRRRIAHAEAQRGLGHYQSGLESARAALADAMATGFGPVRAEALLELSRGQEKLGEHRAAAQSAIEAATLAVAARDDETAVRACSHLAFVLGVRLGQLDEAERWIRQGRAAMARLAEPGQAGVLLLRQQGALAHTSGDGEAAARHLEQALAMQRERFGPDSFELAPILTNLGAVHYAQGDFATASELYRRALERAEAALGPQHPEIASYSSNLANARMAGRDYASAEALHRRALAIRTATLGDRHPEVATAHHHLGLVLQLRQAFDAAAVEHESALATLRAVHGDDHPALGPAYAALGNLALRTRRYAEARAMHARAIEVRQGSVGVDHPELVRSHARIGEAWLAEGHPERAIPLFEDAIAMWSSSLVAHHPDLVTARAALGTALMQTGQLARARTLLERAIEPAERIDAITLAEPRFVLAQVLWPSEPDRAFALARQAASDVADGGPEDLRVRIAAWIDARPATPSRSTRP